MRFVTVYRATAFALGLFVIGMQPAQAAGNLTLPFAIPNPRVTSWMDHHYPTRQEDGLMVRFDGATGYAYDGHRGTNYAVASNTPVVAADDGTVIYSEWSDSGGWGVVMDHDCDRTAYFHNHQLCVYPGQHVSRGQLIALSGSTGNSTGPHVHFEVRDLMTPWHSIDPYGWTGPGPDPWRWDMGNLWAKGTPVPFLLPLAFPGGAHWNYWYGNDGPPPPVSWHLRDGGHGLAGFAAQWDQDPGPGAARTQATSGSAAVPGPGSHTLHLRVFDRAGTSADITYLYLYDVDAPTSALSVGPALASALNLHWSGYDQLSGVNEVAIEVGAGGLGRWHSRGQGRHGRSAIARAGAGAAAGGERRHGHGGRRGRRDCRKRRKRRGGTARRQHGRRRRAVLGNAFGTRPRQQRRGPRIRRCGCRPRGAPDHVDPAGSTGRDDPGWHGAGAGRHSHGCQRRLANLRQPAAAARGELRRSRLRRDDRLAGALA